MISFKLEEEQEIARDALHDYAVQAIRPIARECDEASAIPEEFLAQSWELGLVSTQIPEAYGGGGEARSPVTNAIVLEELAWGDAALALAAVAPAGFAYAIADQGTEAQKQKYLPMFCGEDYCAASLAVNEPTVGFDPLTPRTVAEPKSDGFALSGAKCCVPMGDRASHFLVVARNNGGLDAFVVPRDAEGLSVSDTEVNLGLKALPTATLELERVEVSGADRLGGDDGCDVQRVLDASRTALAAVMVGLSRGYAADQAMWIADQGVQVLGGHGFIRDNPVEMWFRNARTLGVLEGTVCI